MKYTKQLGIGLVLSLGLLTLPAVAQSSADSQVQSSGDSLANYAKQIRKDGPKGHPKVYDNDNLPKEDHLSVIGEARPEGADEDNSAEAKSSENAAGEAKAESKSGEAAGAPAENKNGESKPAADVKPSTDTKSSADKGAKLPEDPAAREAVYKEWQDKIAKQKDQIDLQTRELDVLQREYQLRAASFYADAGNRMRNSAEWDKQDADYKQQIADKQKSIEDAKEQLNNMDEDARKAGVPTSARE